MRLGPHVRRLSTAILRVVAFVVMVPVLAHAHAPAHAGHDHAAGHVRSLATIDAVSGGAGVAVQDAVEQVQAGTDRAYPSDCLGCPGCGCHVFVAAPDHEAARGDWPGGRRVAMGLDPARPSAVPEAIPEPPRSFA